MSEQRLNLRKAGPDRAATQSPCGRHGGTRPPDRLRLRRTPVRGHGAYEPCGPGSPGQPASG